MVVKPAKNCTAEVISIGDEIITGHRLDTNTQWICQRLGDLGIQVRFLSAVGDDLSDHMHAIQNAIQRVDLIVMTGGLGPTADDLTREAIARVLGVPLELNEDQLAKIEKIFQRAGRQMPVNNRAQAMFPVGSMVIPNPEGTAPGVDAVCKREIDSVVRIIALPGVPAEMKQMWSATVEAELRDWSQTNSIFCHHTLHCFGTGESQIEEMLPNLIERGRDPAVGITASSATISLRVATRAGSMAECQSRMQPTIDLIRARLGDLVFGENGQTLPEVVAKHLGERNLTIAVMDFGLGGAIKTELDPYGPQLCYQQIGDPSKAIQRTNDLKVAEGAESIRQESGASIGVVIGPIDRDEHTVTNGRSNFQVGLASPDRYQTHELRYWGHSAWRDERAIKQVLNLIRLHLARE